ncbi:N-acetyl-gamma-glutamyl-phosphate reductase [Alkaliphilus metalliredigens QYMF]|uniref:N-acetyl-gamma-glutamyl-phosphate reductase n=1 Tax=Alkaliphilus metalliredigens (strain QYMF) TaxID=293826 RepID=ARGC_ALKMQ|nr:N-acetyl-gamma-glutamyl-phosphate reductase [Alkaliphilus metalliredigens]A6TTJ3.1 RecName: Full=N-acetyl-gamma-glutamyl-phosphate reductase; Short=AGPR; AltName: Full=N-acetyl-glutamate semialdehyde dehydrogenase; Short=NAGSA dehydrogenase [Alkaliphilus metalliredigens QYMF]ABR49511.1 N-acetyl-gamma-glutamyl-phosphate reductase [Alkaliphilus metalliredigens QYMF]
MIKAGILGSTGYAGAELVRLLTGHPEVEIQFLDSRSYHGKAYEEVYPSLKNIVKGKCASIDLENDFEGIDILFCALPHGLSQEAVKRMMAKGKRVIDLSADFRITDPKVYEAWYDVRHQALGELGKAVYGLSEIYPKEIQEAQLVANPGCYPTSIALALYPLLKENVISTESIIIDAKSGVSGAGRNLNDGTLFSQCNENIKAYSIGTHRHIPEIEQELSLAAGKEMIIQFTPHLVPMNRGILSTIYTTNIKNVKENDIEAIYAHYYEEKRFVRLLKEGKLPQTKAVSGSNYCDIGFKVDPRTNGLIVVSAIDNLVKGAAGQAVQNMNMMLGLKEYIGLEQMPIWP